jgi:hypothetical protein
MPLRNFQTVSIATEELRKNGYDASFELEEDLLKSTTSGKTYSPKDIKIIQFHRFEGDSDSGDEAIVYAIQCIGGEKGTIVSAYGMYGSAALNNFMKKVKIKDKTTVAGPIHKRTYY